MRAHLSVAGQRLTAQHQRASIFIKVSENVAQPDQRETRYERVEVDFWIVAVTSKQGLVSCVIAGVTVLRRTTLVCRNGVSESHGH